MMLLPPDIKESFHKALKGDLSLPDFEEWLYANKHLEGYLNPDDYLELISLNFKISSAEYELDKLLRKHIDDVEFEHYRMFALLKEALLKTDNLPYILIEFYDLYCRGYYFLEDLGLYFGLQVDCAMASSAAAGQQIPQQVQKLLDVCSPLLEAAIEDVLHWLNTKKIVLTGRQDDSGLYCYIDKRTDEEKKAKLWLPVSVKGGTKNEKI